MRTPLTIIDYTIMTFYLAVVIFLGFVASKRQSREGFLIANRNLKTFVTSTSIVASKTGAGVIMTFVALVYLFGYTAIWYFVGTSAGYISFIFFAGDLKKMSYGKNFYNVSDYFFFKYGNTVGFVSASIVLVATVLILLVQLIGGAKAIAYLTGFSYSTSILLLIITIFIYTVLGGFKAVVITDTVQLISMVLIIVFLGFVMTKAFDRNLIFSAITFDKSLPLKSSVSFFVIGILLPFCQADLWQRIYAASDLKTLQRSLVISAFIYFLIGALLCIVALTISLELHDIDPDLALLEGFTTLLPSGMLGFGLVFFCAAIMSSADSYLFACVSIIVHDFVVRIKPIEKDNLVRSFRYAVAVLLLISFMVSFWVKSMVETTFIVLTLAGIIAICGVASWVLKKIRSLTIGSGMVIGFVGTVVFMIIKPIDVSLVLNSIALTIGGFILEYLLTLIFKREKTV
jgi:Na+/proline symporter